MEPLINAIYKTHKSLVDGVAAVAEQLASVSEEQEHVAELNDMVDAMQELTATAGAFKVDVEISSYFVLWGNFYQLGALAQQIIDHINTHFSSKMKTYVSQSTLGEIIRAERSVIDQYTKLRQQNANKWATLLSLIAAAVFEIFRKDEESGLEIIHDEFRLNIKVVDLYIAVITKILDHYAGTPRQRDILNLIESDKNWVLAPDKKKSTGIKLSIPPDNFGLIPITAPLPLADISLIIKGKRPPDLAPRDSSAAGGAVAMKPAALAKSLPGIDLIVIHRITKNPIEYNIYGVLNRHFQKTAGLTTETITNFATIRQNSKPRKWDFSVEHFAAPKGDRVAVVMETSDMYKLMSIDSRPVVLRSEVDGLYAFIAGKVSLRGDNYNSKIMEAAIGSMFLRAHFNLDDELKVKFNVVDIKPIVNGIYLDIIDAFNKSAASSRPQTPAEMREVFINEQYKDILHAGVMAAFHDHFRTNLYAFNDVHIGDVMMTFLFQLSLVERNFHKELGDQFNVYIRKPVETPLKEAFADIVIKLLTKLLPMDSNIFSIMYQKIHFSKLSLV